MTGPVQLPARVRMCLVIHLPIQRRLRIPMRSCRRASFPSNGFRPWKQDRLPAARRALGRRGQMRSSRLRRTCRAGPGRACSKRRSSRASWLPRGGAGGDGFEFDSLELKTVLGLPCPTRAFPLLITPGFAVHFLNGPNSVALPPEVYDAYTEFRWLGHLTPRWGFDVAVTPGVASDFRQDSGHAVRITGHGIAAWTLTPVPAPPTVPTLMLVLGADYLDRTDVPLLPVAGLVWTPNDDTKFELVFPQPKISRRVYWSGISKEDVQDWVYLGGELGGGTWAIRRADGQNDLLNYRDPPRLPGHRAAGDRTDQPAVRGRICLRPQNPVGPGVGRRLSPRHADAPRRAGVLSGRCGSVPLASPVLPCFYPQDMARREAQGTGKASGTPRPAFVSPSVLSGGLRRRLAAFRLSPMVYYRYPHHSLPFAPPKENCRENPASLVRAVVDRNHVQPACERLSEKCRPLPLRETAAFCGPVAEGL